jgi:hypothetical protein
LKEFTMRRLISAITITFAAAVAHAQPDAKPDAAASPDREQHLPMQPANGLPKEEPAAMRRKDGYLTIGAIEREVKDIEAGRRPAPDWAKEWAGIYDNRVFESLATIGAPPGSLIAVGPTQAAEMMGAGGWCLFPPASRFGLVVEGSQEGVTIRWQRPDAQFGEPVRLYFVRWKGERYIADGKSIANMLNEYNRSGRVQADWHKRRVPDSIPELPALFSRGLRNGPFTLDVRSIDDRGVIIDQLSPSCLQLSIELGNGSADGVYVGMDLLCNVVPAGADLPPRPRRNDPSATEPDAWIVIDHVEEHRSTGRFRFTVEEGPPLLPRAGDRLVTFQLW